MNLIERLFDVTDLDLFIKDNIQSFNEFYNYEFDKIVHYKDSVERFILLKTSLIEDLDYTKSYNKAFISILLDFCERFNFIAATPRLYSVLEKNDIIIGNRLQAALLYLYNIDSIPTLLNRFELICDKLQIAIECEEDNEKKAISTFLNYYSTIIRDTHPHVQYALESKKKIENAIERGTYLFLNNEYVKEALTVDFQDAEGAFTRIQTIVDKLLEKRISVQVVEVVEIEAPLVEENTKYIEELSKIRRISFNSIRAISVRLSDGTAVTNRGVKILESEEELMAYMRRFGNMHKAKLESALDALPDKILSNLNIIDWGCGQGIASMVFLEMYGFKSVNNFVLIEPSEKALKRSSLHLRKFNPKVAIKTICKKLNDLSENDFQKTTNQTTIHLFSNILDIDDYSQNQLIELIRKVQFGENYFVCVSPYIDDIKADRVDSFKRFFEKEYFKSFSLLSEETTTKSVDDEFWLCNNTSKGEILHGKYQNCYDFTESGGCCNKWTRIIRVFKVTF